VSMTDDVMGNGSLADIARHVEVHSRNEGSQCVSMTWLELTARQAVPLVGRGLCQRRLALEAADGRRGVSDRLVRAAQAVTAQVEFESKS